MLPAAEDDLQHEPAAAGKLVRRPRRRAGRGAVALRGRRAPCHAHGPRRHGQDAARDRGRRDARPRVQGRRLLGRAGHAARPRARHRDDRPDARRQGRPRRAHRRAGAAAPARQPRAGGRGGARALRAPRGLPQPHAARHQPRAAARRGRGRVPRPAARRARGGRALLRALAARADRRDRRALPAPGRHAARGRAGRRADEGALAAQILERLSQRLDLLKGGRDADPRQQTLRATIEWSTSCSTHEEQRLFARLSVFAGGCTLEAAEEVADADLDTLQSLVEKSLSRFTDGATGCWRRSASTRRSGSRSRARRDDLRRRHASYFLGLAEEASRLDREQRQTGSTGSSASTTTCEPRSTGSWAIGEPERAVRLVGALWRLLGSRAATARGLAMARGELLDGRPTRVRVKATSACGRVRLRGHEGDAAAARASARRPRLPRDRRRRRSAHAPSIARRARCRRR